METSSVAAPSLTTASWGSARDREKFRATTRRATDCREEAIDGERCEAIDLPPPGATDFL